MKKNIIVLTMLATIAGNSATNCMYNNHKAINIDNLRDILAQQTLQEEGEKALKAKKEAEEKKAKADLVAKASMQAELLTMAKLEHISEDTINTLKRSAATLNNSINLYTEKPLNLPMEYILLCSLFQNNLNAHYIHGMGDEHIAALPIHTRTAVTAFKKNTSSTYLAPIQVAIITDAITMFTTCYKIPANLYAQKTLTETILWGKPVLCAGALAAGTILQMADIPWKLLGFMWNNSYSIASSTGSLLLYSTPFIITAALANHATRNALWTACKTQWKNRQNNGAPASLIAPQTTSTLVSLAAETIDNYAEKNPINQ